MTPTRRPLILSALMIAAVILGCSLPGRPPAPEAPLAPEQPTNAPPTVAPSPTPTDLKANPDVQTRLIAQRPAAGEELPPDGTIDLYFNQPMDQASVAEALSISPAVDYTIEWPTNAAARIIPAGLDRDATYTVQLGEGARNTLGNPVEGTSRFQVATVGFIQVTDSVPFDAANGTPTDAPITVFFNTPIVPLTNLQSADDLPDPLRFSPEVPGQGEWIGTSIYRWYPDDPLAAGTAYEILIEAGLEGQGGHILREDHIIRFETQLPRAQSAEYDQLRGQGDTLLDSPVSVTFNQPMEQASTEDAFSLSSNGAAVAGAFEWDETNTAITFTPDALLAPDTVYTLQVADTARDFTGSATLAAPFTETFTTVPLPQVESVNPEPGSTGAYPFTSINISFNTEMDEDSLYADDRITISPEPEAEYSSFAGSNNLSVFTRLNPGTTYTVTLNPGARDRFGNTISEPFTYSFTIRNAEPRVQLNQGESFGLYNAETPNEVALVTINFDEVGLELYAIENIEQAMLDPGYIPADDPLSTWSIDTEGPLNESIIEPVSMGDLAPGIYRLVVTNYQRFDDTPLTHTLIVSNAHVTLKTGFDESLVWVTDLDSGAAISGADVTLFSDFRDRGIQQIGAGQTGSDGLAQLDTDQLRNLPFGSRYYSLQRTYALIEGDGVFGVGLSDWSEDTRPETFDLPSASRDAEQTLYLYTDRPLYRPGDTVYFRGILRNKDDMTFSIPSETVDLRVDANNFETGESFSFEENYTVDDFGAFHGEFTLPAEAPLGTYTINVETDGDRVDFLAGGPYSYTDAGFRVAEFRKPEFETIVTPEVEQILDGESFETTFTADYFFGGRVTNSPLSYEIESFPYSIEGPRGYTFSDPDNLYDFGPRFDFGRFVASGEGDLGSDGTFTLTTEADLPQDSTTRRYVIEGTVTDEANQPISGRANVIVHATEHYVGINPGGYFIPAGESFPIDLIALDWQGSPLPEKAVSVQLYSQTWERIRIYDETGNPQWRWQTTRTPVGDPIDLQTDERGEVAAQVPIDEPGSYRIVASTEDPNGRTHNASVFVWVSGSGYTDWRTGDVDKQLDIITDATAYNAGDTAELLITSPFAGEAQALITVERDGILFSEVITVSGGATRYDIPIPIDYAPNAYISVTLYRAAGDGLPDYRFGLTEIEVSPEPRLLDVTITPDRDVIAPGEDVTFTITTNDSAGNPVDAQLSLAIVDKALLILEEDNTVPIEEHFFPRQPLGVLTSVGLSAYVEAQLIELLPPDGGGRGGGGGGGGAAIPPIREEFEDTAFWSATIRTGESGSTEVTVTMPDNLTTWVMDARAVTLDTQVGQTRSEFQSTLPLLVRPVTPRFLVEGDQALISAIVNNNTPSAVDAIVTLEAEGLSINDEAAQTVTIDSGGRQVVTWRTTVDQQAANAELIFRVQGGGFSDATRPTLGEDGLLPIYRYETIETISTSGQLAEAGTRTEGILVPPDFVTPDGELNLTLTPSLAAPTIAGLDYLANLDYLSIEGVVNRFLPNVVTAQALRELGVDNPELEQNLDAQITDALAELKTNQLSTGGWGWSLNTREETDLLTTLYAFEGLITAQQAGYTVDQQMINAAQNYLTTLSDPPPPALNAYRAYVLSLAGVEVDIDQLYDQRDTLPTYAVGFLALAIDNTSGDADRLTVLRDQLTRAAVLDATGAHWPDERQSFWSTDTRSTAVVLGTFAQLWPDSDLMPNAVRWLMTARRADHWASSQETAWSIMALSRVMQATGELEPDYTWALAVSGDERLTGEATPDTAAQSERLSLPLADVLAEGLTPFTIQRGNGPGRLYYSADLRLSPPVPLVPAVNDRGITVVRRYLNAEGNEVTGGTVGDELTVEITLITDRQLNYLVLEDYYPAGAEAIDGRLLTESRLGEDTNNPDFAYGWNWRWFDSIQLRDEKAVMTANFVPAGTLQYTYNIRLTTAGEFHVIPTLAEQVYAPNIFGREAGLTFTIEPAE